MLENKVSGAKIKEANKIYDWIKRYELDSNMNFNSTNDERLVVIVPSSSDLKYWSQYKTIKPRVTYGAEANIYIVVQIIRDKFLFNDVSRCGEYIEVNKVGLLIAGDANTYIRYKVYKKENFIEDIRKDWGLCVTHEVELAKQHIPSVIEVEDTEITDTSISIFSNSSRYTVANRLVASNPIDLGAKEFVLIRYPDEDVIMSIEEALENDIIHEVGKSKIIMEIKSNYETFKLGEIPLPNNTCEYGNDVILLGIKTEKGIKRLKTLSLTQAKDIIGLTCEGSSQGGKYRIEVFSNLNTYFTLGDEVLECKKNTIDYEEVIVSTKDNGSVKKIPLPQSLSMQVFTNNVYEEISYVINSDEDKLDGNEKWQKIKKLYRDSPQMKETFDKWSLEYKISQGFLQ